MKSDVCGYSEYFSEYYDGAAENADEFEAHLQSCSACALEYKKFCDFITEINNLPEPQPPSGFCDALIQGVKREAARQRRQKKRVFYSQLALSAAASVLFAVIWISGYFGENSSPERRFIDNTEYAFDSRDFYDTLTKAESAPLNDFGVNTAPVPTEDGSRIYDFHDFVVDENIEITGNDLTRQMDADGFSGGLENATPHRTMSEITENDLPQQMRVDGFDFGGGERGLTEADEQRVNFRLDIRNEAVPRDGGDFGSFRSVLGLLGFVVSAALLILIFFSHKKQKKE